MSERTPCTDCGQPARHRLGTGDQWGEFCCPHADRFMRQLALTVPEDEGRTGWQKWKADHRAMCEGLLP